MSGQNNSGTAGGVFSSRLSAYRNRFDNWRRTRPFPGGVMLIVAGFITGWIPIQLASDLMLVGRMVTGIGLLWSALMVMTGVFALKFPQHSSKIGIAGVVVSILSLFGALGGLVIGMVLGIFGGNLCYGWHPDEDVAADVYANRSNFSWEQEATESGPAPESGADDEERHRDGLLDRFR